MDFKFEFSRGFCHWVPELFSCQPQTSILLTEQTNKLIKRKQENCEIFQLLSFKTLIKFPTFLLNRKGFNQQLKNVSKRVKTVIYYCLEYKFKVFCRLLFFSKRFRISLFFCLFFRTEYWKSQTKKFCEFCKCWISDNKVVSLTASKLREFRHITVVFHPSDCF